VKCIWCPLFFGEAIERSLNEIEDIYLAQIRIESLRAGQSKAYTLEEVERELGLADNN
jgi:RHH-type rel operon transcriptional repressor/antitoxin RelB